MRRFARVCLLLVLSVCIMTGMTLPARAEGSATYTYTPALDSGWVRTQDAYQVVEVMFKEVELKLPRDILIRDNICYIADTGNGRVVTYDLLTKETKIIGEGVLTAPAGLFLSAQKQLYVADRDGGAVVIFDADGQLVKSLGRPTTVTFGLEAVYRPVRVVVNNSGTIYVVSEGAYDGIIQLDHDGEFLGYFGYNNNPMTAWDWIADHLFTEAMRDQLTNRIPYSFYSVDMDKKGMLYTVTQGANGNALKKHDVSGQNLFSVTADELNFADVCVGANGEIYAVTTTGLIFEYDASGMPIFTWGGSAVASEKNGVFTAVSAITCDEAGRVYALDSERGLVHVMTATDYARSYHQANTFYDSGEYTQAEALWRHIKAVGGSNYYVENSLAQCLYEQGRYDEAAQHYKIAGNRSGYSNAYWQIRNDQIATLVPYLLVAAVVIWLAVMLYNRFAQPKERTKPRSIWVEDAAMLGKAVRHPINTFSDIRYEGKGHIVTALVLFVVEFALYLWYFIGAGFMLIGNSGEDASILFLSVMFWGLVALFIGCDYLVSEVGEGKARLRDIVISTAYTLAPFVIMMPFVLLFSYVITGNEMRILQLVLIAMVCWVVVNVIIATREINEFDVGETIRHLLITIFFMAVVVLAGSLVYMLCDRMIDMIISIVKEARYRVVG